jgi:hypothetical protein
LRRMTLSSTRAGLAAFRAGAALAMLDLRMRADVPFAGVWRRRLALKAAAATARIARRGEDEATLRDAFLLRHGGDDPGPAGRMLVARPRPPPRPHPCHYGELCSDRRKRLDQWRPHVRTLSHIHRPEKNRPIPGGSLPVGVRLLRSTCRRRARGSAPAYDPLRTRGQKR